MSKVPIPLLLFPLWWVFPTLNFATWPHSGHWTYGCTSSLKILKVYPPRHYRHEGLTDKIECFNCSAMKPKSTMNRQWLNRTRSDGMQSNRTSSWTASTSVSISISESIEKGSFSIMYGWVAIGSAYVWSRT
jgi:hypothetical protein